MLVFLNKYKYRLLILTGLALFFIAAFQIFIAESMELKAFDHRQKARMKPASSNIVIVAIDDLTIQETRKLTHHGFGRFPWPRPVIGNVLRKIESYNPKAIIVDLEYSGQNIPYENPDLNDEMFEETLKHLKKTFLCRI
jgi:adenylate cyclase